MKKLLTLSLASFGLLFGASVFAADGSWGGDNSGQDLGCCQPQQDLCQPPERQCGDAYVKYCKYTPCYYNEYRTVCDQKCTQKQCCRYVNKPYEKTCCKYVPQYYTQTCNRLCPEYYTVNDTVNCYRKVCDKKVKWVPQYYYKNVCGPEAESYAAPAAGGCASGSCAQ